MEHFQDHLPVSENKAVEVKEVKEPEYQPEVMEVEDTPDLQASEPSDSAANISDEFFDDEGIPTIDWDAKSNPNQRMLYLPGSPVADTEKGQDFRTENLGATATEEEIYHTAAALQADQYQNSYQEDYFKGQAVFLERNLKAGNIKVGLEPVKMDVSGKKELSGQRAVLAITSVLGLANVVQVPMVNSGFRVFLAAAMPEEFSALEERIAKHRNELGWYTLGLSHSIEDIYSRRELIKFFVDHIIDCNVIGWRDEENQPNYALFEQIIKHGDYQTMDLAALAAFYTRGHNVSTPCIAIPTSEDEPVCNAINSGIVHFERMWWCNKPALTRDQIKHMCTSIKHRFTKEEVLKYQATLEFTHDTVEFTSSNGAKLVTKFSSPSAEREIIAGTEWITRMNEILLNDCRNLNDRRAEQAFLEKLVADNQLRLFTPWIDHLVVNTPDGASITITDFETINAAIAQFGSSEEVIGRVIDGIWEFINYSSKVVIGVSQHKCTSCGRLQSNTDATMPSIVPVDITETFFTLQTPGIAQSTLAVFGQ